MTESARVSCLSGSAWAANGLAMNSTFTIFARFCTNERMDILRRMRHRGVSLVLFSVMGLVACQPLLAQRSEIGFGVGGSFYMGDINPKKIFYKTQWAGSLFYRYNINTRMALRFGLSYGRIMGADSDFGNLRNLNFRNDLWEVSALWEVNFLDFFTGSRQHRLAPYLVLGAGMAMSDPYGAYPDAETGSSRWVALRPLRTEGQGVEGYDLKPYSRFQFVVPMGLGLKFSVFRFMSIGVEWTMRLAFTDYLDDVGGTYANPGILGSQYGPESAYFADPSGTCHQAGSRRGDAGTYDWYSFALFTVSFRLPGKDVLCPAYDGTSLSKKRR